MTSLEELLLMKDSKSISEQMLFSIKEVQKSKESFDETLKRLNELQEEAIRRNKIIITATQTNLELQKSEERSNILRDLVSDLIDPDDCSLDQHGYCHAHGYAVDGKECPHFRAKKLLKCW